MRKHTLRPAVFARIALLAAVTAVLAQISIPLPFTPVPFSLGQAGALAAGLLLTPGQALLSQMVYLALGAAGLPVFAQMHGGIAALLGPTGGFLFAYPIMAACVSALCRALAGAGAPRPRARRNYAAALVSCVVGLALLYASGALWLAGYLHVGFARALALGALPYVPFDLCKAALVCVLAARVPSFLPRGG